MKYLLAFMSLLLGMLLAAQAQTKRILFIGNSYTNVNDLPQIVKDIALSMGDTVEVGRSTPGGYTLEGHSQNNSTLTKIAEGNWDYIVLQGQSQRSSFPNDYVEANVFPYAAFLDSVINLHNPCGETVFYMTWGRKNGDASNCQAWPPVCTYEGMDALLRQRYRQMADDNSAIVSPVGAVWHNIRTNSPNIELYSSDESHPSAAGSYAGACAFYTALFRKDPSLISYDYSIPAADATSIRAAAKTVVFDSLVHWKVGTYDTKASFLYTNSDSTEVSFSNTSAFATSYLWDFGDGDTSTSANPTHTYANGGAYTVRLIAEKCGIQDTSTQTIMLASTSIVNPLYEQIKWNIYPNPVQSTLRIESDRQFSHLRYKIINPIGVEIQTGEIDPISHQIDLRALPAAFYILQVFDGKHLAGQHLFEKMDSK